MKNPKAEKLMEAIEFLEDRVTLRHTQGSMHSAVLSVRKAALELIKDERERNENETHDEMIL